MKNDQVFGRGVKAVHSDNMAEALKEKIEEIENLFRIKEGKMKENYEETILNLEGRLEKEQERFKEQSQRQNEEKEALLESHKSEIQKLAQDGKEVQDALKDEYMSAINKLRELRQIELESVDEIASSTSKLSDITSKVEIILIITFIIVNLIIITTRPKPASGRQGLVGSWGQDTNEVSTFLVFLTSHFAPAALSSDLTNLGPLTMESDQKP